MDAFKQQNLASARQAVQAERADRLLVVGTINLATAKARLQPLFVIPNATEMQPRVPGDYAIVLRNAQNALLVRYAFTPQELDDADDLLFVNELVTAPASNALNAAGGSTSASITIDNQNWLNPITWNATASASWVVLSAASGQTPDDLSVSLDVTHLPAGTHEVTITFTSPDSPGDSVSVRVRGTGSGPTPIVVGNGAPQDCTAARLHSALQEARDKQVYRVAFSCGKAPHTITLDKTVVIGTDMEVDGGGTITLSGDDKVRIFEVCSPSGGGAADFTLSLRGLTLTRGRSDPNRAGGAITNYGCRVSIANSTLVRNTAVFEAGAINNMFGGTLAIYDSLFSSNQATTNGGVISAQTGEVMISNSTFTNNTASSNGGVIYASSAVKLQISGSTFTGNRALAAGGAIRSDGATSIADTGFSKNSTRNGSGGAILNSGGLEITRVTFDGNRAVRDPGAPQPSSAQGGAFANEHAQEVLVSNSTFWENSAAGEGGAIYHRADSAAMRLVNVTIARASGSGLAGSMTISNSIVAHSTGANCTGGITATGSNLEFPGTSCGASIQQADPLLDTGLKANGGSIATMALQLGSPAINTGRNSICAAPPVNNQDQRG